MTTSQKNKIISELQYLFTQLNFDKTIKGKKIIKIIGNTEFFEELSNPKFKKLSSLLFN